MRLALQCLAALLCLLPCMHAAAQEKVNRVGLLHFGQQAARPQVLTTWRSELLRVFARNSAELGRRVELVDRYAEGHLDRLPALAREINDAGVDVVIAVGDRVIQTVLAETQSTPVIIVTGVDPVAVGWATSLARPGGRVSGIVLRTPEGDVKRLELLREAFPTARRFGFLAPDYPLLPGTAEQLAQGAAKLGITLTTRTVKGPSDYAAAFAAMREAGTAAVLVAATAQLASDATRVVESATRERLPTICEWDYMARLGCMLSYGHDLTYAQRRVAEYALRILKGANIAELPIEQLDAWKLTVNLRAAAQFGVAVPESVLARADDLIE